MILGIEKLVAHKLCYLATPYSKHKAGIHMAFIEASVAASKLLVAGVKVYSPIAHTHPLAIYGNIDPLAHDIWIPFDEAMMQACEALIVLEMDGWQESKGITHEIDFFVMRGKPVYYLPANF